MNLSLSTSTIKGTIQSLDPNRDIPVQHFTSECQTRLVAISVISPACHQQHLQKSKSIWVSKVIGSVVTA